MVEQINSGLREFQGNYSRLARLDGRAQGYNAVAACQDPC